mmetsp:Transcript_19591/g.39716  ORF Transcript_19591/g.39716 Transcript_19591/m.39716 type:complete len:80 (-) Transcript_19591:680-919(-)
MSTPQPSVKTGGKKKVPEMHAYSEGCPLRALPGGKRACPAVAKGLCFAFLFPYRKRIPSWWLPGAAGLLIVGSCVCDAN